MRSSLILAGASLTGVAMAADTVDLMLRDFFFDSYGLAAMSIGQFSAATTYILGCTPEYVAEDKNWCMLVLPTPMTVTQGPETLSLRKPVLGDINTGVTEDWACKIASTTSVHCTITFDGDGPSISEFAGYNTHETYTGTDAATMFGQFALVSDKSGIWSSKVDGVVMYSTTTQWIGQGTTRVMTEVLVPTRTLSPTPSEAGDDIPNPKTGLTGLPTLSEASKGQCGEECMSSSKFWATQTGTSSAPFFFSQTTASSADEATETGKIEVVEGGAVQMGIGAWIVGVVAAVVASVAL